MCRRCSPGGRSATLRAHDREAMAEERIQWMPRVHAAQERRTRRSSTAGRVRVIEHVGSPPRHRGWAWWRALAVRTPWVVEAQVIGIERVDRDQHHVERRRFVRWRRQLDLGAGSRGVAEHAVSSMPLSGIWCAPDERADPTAHSRPHQKRRVTVAIEVDQLRLSCSTACAIGCAENAFKLCTRRSSRKIGTKRSRTRPAATTARASSAGRQRRHQHEHQRPQLTETQRVVSHGILIREDAPVGYRQTDERAPSAARTDTAATRWPLDPTRRCCRRRLQRRASHANAERGRAAAAQHVIASLANVCEARERTELSRQPPRRSEPQREPQQRASAAGK